MQFTPEKYRIPDVPMQPFIDTDEIWEYLNSAVPTPEKVREIIDKSLSKKKIKPGGDGNANQCIRPRINSTNQRGCQRTEKRIYGNRIVLLPPTLCR